MRPLVNAGGRFLLGLALAAAPAAARKPVPHRARPAAATGIASAEGGGYASARAIVGDLDKIVAPDGIQETFTATLGGAQQVVNVRGADRLNPILVFVHGGPGSTEMPIAWTFQRPWEDFFTVVQWDQRGAGRSFPLNDPKTLAPTLSLDRYRDDAIELIELLRRKYGKRRVILLGHSFGSAVGLAVAAKRPDLLYAYVGMGQLIDWRENERQGFNWTIQHARAINDADALRDLEPMVPYPGTGQITLAQLDTERKWSIRYGALIANRSAADFYFDVRHLSPDYSEADLKAHADGSRFTIETMLPRLDRIAFSGLHRLNVPVILLEGQHDYTTPWPIAAAWMKQLHAPSKRFVLFQNSAHMPMIEEPGRTLKALLDYARPLAMK
jgi:proline iminopeptidase